VPAAVAVTSGLLSWHHVFAFSLGAFVCVRENGTGEKQGDREGGLDYETSSSLDKYKSSLCVRKEVAVSTPH